MRTPSNRLLLRSTGSISNRILVATLMALAIGVALFAMPALPVSAVLTSKVQTTAAEFNTGTFYRTGLTTKTDGGGDGNGEVRLMTVGISSAEWKSDGNVTGLPPLQGHAAVHKNGRIYVSGGASPGSGFGEGTRWISYTTILSTTTHNLSDWLPTNSLNVDLMNHGMVAVGNYMYILGGFVSLFPTNTVYYAPINADGTLGTWNTTAALPGVRANFATVVVSDTIYVLGGGGVLDVPQNTVFYAKPNSSNGTISSWTTNAVPLPQPLAQLAAASFDGRIYFVGGTDGTTFYPDAYYTTPQSNGSITVWTQASDVGQTNLVNAAGTAFGGQIYFAGGATNDGQDLLTAIASNLLNEDGSPSGWVNSFVLSNERQLTAAVVSDDGWMYVIEGNPGTGINPLHTIDYGPLSAGGSTYANSGRFTSSVMDLGGSYPVMTIDWNAVVSNVVSMTLQYRVGNSIDLGGVGWSDAFGVASPSANPVTRTINVNQTARYVQYRVNLSTTDTTQTPVLNAVAVIYDVPAFPDFSITGMTAPPSLAITSTQVVTYWVANLRAPAAPVRQPSASSSVRTSAPQTGRFPPPPFSVSSASPRGANAPQDPPLPTYMFWVTFYANPSPVPTGPQLQAGKMTCLDYNNPLHPPGSYEPFIYYNHELGKTASVFYAQCTVPPNVTEFYAQIDTCTPSDSYCTSTGYVLEFDELSIPPSFANNIKGPLRPGESVGGPGGSGGVYLPYIRRSP